MMRWKKEGNKFTANGTIITYAAPGTDLTIESRKRQIPHANGHSGTWEYTSFYVLKGRHVLVEKHSLTDAKEYAEEVANSGNNL